MSDRPTEAFPTTPYPTEVLAPASTPPNDGGADAGARPARSRGRGWFIALGVVVLLAVGLVAAEFIVRGQIEQRISGEAEQNLPEGITGEVTTELGGFSVLAQLIAGRFDEVHLSAPELSFRGDALSAEVHAYGVPLAEGGTVGHAEGELSVDAAILAEQLEVPGDGAFTLGDGTISYGDSTSFLGQEIGFTVTATPAAAGTAILLQPESVEVNWGGASLDLGGLADRITGSEPVSLCVADRLPEGVEVRHVGVTPERATVRVAASGFPLDAEMLERPGSCE
ncbi:LmeA family phospholipid-binding protein [Agromyces archimandritae]|uniref:DUF2993 domain-containing protein n=1 Tax=Agromyces archimandritae TaxID=2781962 RepID=A0A975FNG0_9MICO|nr:DUF2993 domain-containing protein [Agromyces archimandritae]QTX05171.1 DUF2993 domain-containing protein [Agromyces archimandritae]